MSYQRSLVFSGFQNFTGNIYSKISNVKMYFRLRSINDSLLAENVRLRELVYAVPKIDRPDSFVKDTQNNIKFKLKFAYVVNNTINRKNNIIVLNRGKLDGIHNQMGVITDKGIVGIVTHTSDHFALVMSVLSEEFRVSAKIVESGEIGSLSWDGKSPENMVLKDIPNQVKVLRKHQVVVGPYSRFFPENTPVGIIKDFNISSNNSLIEVKVKLHNKIRNLQSVYLIDNMKALEQAELEKNADEK